VPAHPDDDLTIGATMVPTPVSGAGRYAPGAIVASRYRLVALLGRGGMGEVYRAEDLTLDQPVALKFLPDGVAADAARLAQFHGELRLARQVSHKNVCPWATVILRELQITFGAVLLFVVLRLLTGRAWIAIAVGMAIVFYWWSAFAMTPLLWTELTYEILVVAAFTAVMIRFGLLSAAVARIVLGICESIPFTLQASHWSATPSTWTIAAIVALAAFGFYASRAGRPLFGGFAAGEIRS